MDDYLNVNEYLDKDKLSENNELGEIKEEYFFYDNNLNHDFFNK